VQKDINLQKVSVKLRQMTIKIHVYRLNQDDIAFETIHKDGEEISAAAHWILPSEEFFGLWENLFYDLGVKENVNKIPFLLTIVPFFYNTNIIIIVSKLC
jgi:hypothetical protein